MGKEKKAERGKIERLDYSRRKEEQERQTQLGFADPCDLAFAL